MTRIQTLLCDPDLLQEGIDGVVPGANAERYRSLLSRLTTELGVDPTRNVFFVSSPGRTELAGNHTDHNHGKVLAASVGLDTVAAIAPRDDSAVVLASEGFPETRVDLADLAVHEEERETTAALVRGTAAALSTEGRAIGGFDAAVASRVTAGSGLSSSASIEVLIGTILNVGWNGGTIDAGGIAKAGQFAENMYFGKPSGLMDQLACATGGVIAIDFKDDDHPVVDRITSSFTAGDLSLLVVHTGGGHADLTAEYAAIPAEMAAVAGLFGAAVLADVPEREFVRRLPDVRRAAGDRATLRALHFYRENGRVDEMASALCRHDFQSYLDLMQESGRSSAMYLQNCVPPGTPREQAVMVALALSERFMIEAGLKPGRDAACRVHGGGFAGTIQVLLPVRHAGSYRETMERVIGSHSVTELSIRPTGAVAW